MVLPTLSVYMLGGFQIYHGERPLMDSFKPRLQALLAYLLLHRKTPPSRQFLAFHFWPDSTEARARANLRKLVYRLRQVFPEIEHYLELEAATLSCRERAPIWLDVADFEARMGMVDSTSVQEQQEILEAALALYKGNLLPDVYDDWILALREQLHQRYLGALDLLAERLEARRNYVAAEQTVRRLLREDPLQESAYRRLMRLQTLSGDVAGALRSYHRCTRLLEQEFGVEPCEATQQVYLRLLERREPLEPAPTTNAPRLLPLVGRDVAWQQLLDAWKLADAGRPQVVVISGEAGIGKTRLAEELLSWTNRQGITTLSAACFAAEAPLPLLPVADWLRSEAGGRALPALGTRWRNEVARILPEMLAADSELEMPRPMTEAWQKQHFFMALAEAVTVAGEPLLLFLDDLHWAAAETLDWLHFLVRQKGDRRFLLVVTVRSEELALDHSLFSWQQALARVIPLQWITLDRLTPGATAALASSILGRSLEHETVATLHRETEGNPLFTVEMVRAGIERSPGTLPEKMHSVIEHRLVQLSPAAQQVAALAAVIGRSFAFPLLKAAGPQSEAELIDSLDELWQRQIIREQGENGYDFSHDKIREVALGRLDVARRRWWHRRVAEALERSFAGQMESTYGQIALHWEGAGEHKKAAAAYQLAGEEAKRLFANDEALHAYRKALGLLESYTTTGLCAQRAQLFSELGSILLRTGRNQEAQAAFEDALQSMPPGSAQEARLHRLLGDSLEAQRLYEEALAAYVRAEAALPDKEQLSPGPELGHWIDIQLSRLGLFYRQGDTRRIRVLMDDVGPIVERQGAPQQRIRYLLAGGLLSVLRARYAQPLDEALLYSQRALRASREADLKWQICHSHFGVGFIRLWRGEGEQAQGEFETALGMAEEIGYEEVRLLSLTYLCVLNRRRTACMQAETFARQSLEVARAGKWDTYIAAGEANLAWVAWSSGDANDARQRGNLALDLWQGSAYPFQWLALWPLLAISLEAGEVEKALNLARALLAPTQQRLPAPVTLAVESALQAETLPGAHSHLEVALRLAQEHRFL
jgi:DNA-binding SARP family transcriptional activator